MTFDEKKLEILETLAEAVGDYRYAIDNSEFQKTVSLETLRREMFSTFNEYILLLEQEDNEQ